MVLEHESWKTEEKTVNITMKTLREYIDQLDEISRRDFLKGAGAAAIAGAGAIVPTIAKGQIIGGGEQEAKDSATRAGNMFFSLTKGAHRDTAQWVSNTIYNRVLQYYNFGGKQIPEVSEVGLRAAYESVSDDFQRIYQVAEKDKQDTSLAGTYLRNRLGNRFGVDVGGRDAQLKMAGSLERFNVTPLAEKFVASYTRALQEALNHFKQQKETTEQPASSLDEASPDAVKRIEELVKYK